MNTSPRVLPAALTSLALAGVLLVTACQDTGAMAPIPGGFDPAQRIASGVQARLSAQGLGTLSTVVDRLLVQSFPSGLEFPIAPQCTGDTRICCATPDPQCKAEATLAGTTFTAAEPRSARFVLRSTLVTSSAAGPFMPVRTTVLGIGVDCQVAIDTSRAGKPDLGLSGRLVFEVDPQSDLTRVSIANADVIDLDDGDLEIAGGALCAIANIIKPIIVGIVVDQFTSSLSALVEQQLCVKCPGAAPLEDECGAEATSCQDGLCMEGTRCLQRLGVEGRMDASALLAGLGTAGNGQLDVSFVAGGFAMAQNGGLSLGVLAGLSPAAEESASCVPEAPTPPIESVPPDDALLGQQTAPADHDVILAIHTTVLDRIGWVLYRSGALCLDVGQGAVDSSLIGALTPSLAHLLDRRPVPVRVSLRPTAPPTFTVGKNTFDPVTGEPAEPLVELRLVGAKIDLYALVHERFVRFAQLQTDITLPLAVRVDENGRLLPVPGDLGAVLGDTKVETNGLLAEPADDLTRLTEEAVAILLPSFTDTLSAFQLPTFAGLELRVAQAGLTSNEDSSLLTLYAELVPQPEEDAAASPASCSAVPGSRGCRGLLIVIAAILLCALLRRRGSATFLALLGLAAGSLGCGGNGPNGTAEPTDSASESGSEPDPADVPSPGASGSHADMTSHAGVLWVSGYEEKYGDLLVGRASVDTVEWRFADGVPSAAPTGPLSGYRGGIDAVGDDVGQYTSIAVAPSGEVYVAHHDATRGALRLTRSTSDAGDAFTSHEVDALPDGVLPGERRGPRLAAVGLHSSLALLGSGRPIIAYLATGIPAEAGGIRSELRVARAKTPQPASPSDWEIAVVDSAPIPCASRCPAGFACVALPTAEGEPAAGSRCFAEQPCRTACSSERACVDLGDGPKCHTPLPAQLVHDLPAGTGLWPSLAVLPGDALVIAYYDANAGALRLARGDSQGFALETIDDAGDIGAYPSLVVSEDGGLRLAYQNRTTGQLLFRVVGGAEDGLRQVVDSGARQGERHFVGADARLVGSGSSAWIAYQDQTTADLLLASRGSDGAWTRSSLAATAAGEGFYVCGAMTSTSAVFAHFVLDAAQTPRGRLAVVTP